MTSEWIKHNGNGMPVDPYQSVTVRQRDGLEISCIHAAMHHGWKHTYSTEDIMEYRIEGEATPTIDATLAERGSRYGEFPEHARITQNLKRAMKDSPNWQLLPDDMKESLEMLAHKVARILNGDPDYHDSWHDIIGYTKLVADRLNGQAAKAGA